MNFSHLPTRSIPLDFELNYMEVAVSILELKQNVQASNFVSDLVMASSFIHWTIDIRFWLKTFNCIQQTLYPEIRCHLNACAIFVWLAYDVCTSILCHDKFILICVCGSIHRRVWQQTNDGEFHNRHTCWLKSCQETTMKQYRWLGARLQ